MVYIAKGYKTEDGPLPEKYNLQEISTSSYPKSIEKNVQNSDGSLIITHGEFTENLSMTTEFCLKHNMPFFHINLNKTPKSKAASEINSWIIKHEIEILNVSGSQTKEDPDIYQDTMYIIEGVILYGLVQDQAGSLITGHHNSESSHIKPPLKKFPIWFFLVVGLIGSVILGPIGVIVLENDISIQALEGLWWFPFFFLFLSVGYIIGIITRGAKRSNFYFRAIWYVIVGSIFLFVLFPLRFSLE